jgi:hypothetical protein
MKMTLKQVWEATELLPQRDILKLRDLLNKKYDDSAIVDESEIVEDELFQELERRRLDCEKHPEKLIPWEVVLRELEAKLK